MNSLKPGDVGLIRIPFTDLSQAKKRPALILLSRGADNLVAFFTSRLTQAGPDDVIVRAAPENGLAVDSAVLVTKLFTLHETLLDRRLGRLSAAEYRNIIERLVKLLRSTTDQ